MTVTAGGSTLTVTPAGPLAAGPTRVEFVRTSGEPSLSLAALRPGVTVEAFTAALRKGDNEAIELLYIDAGADLDAQEDESVSTISLRPGLTYVAVNTEGRNRAAFEVVTVVHGQHDAQRRHRAERRRDGADGRPALHGRPHAAPQRHDPVPQPGLGAALRGRRQAPFRRVVRSHRTRAAGR